MTIMFMYWTTGATVFPRRIPGPSEAPGNFKFSESGEWLVFTHGSMTTFVANTKSGKVEVVDTPSLNWEVADNGSISGWKLEEDGNHYERRNGRLVGVRGRSTFRRVIRAIGSTSITPTEAGLEK